MITTNTPSDTRSFPENNEASTTVHNTVKLNNRRKNVFSLEGAVTAGSDCGMADENKRPVKPV
jgi:hypothetical protein